MRTQQSNQREIEELLRQRAPKLRAPDRSRVDAACAQIASAPPLSPLRAPHTFTRPLLRVAACLILMFGIALLMRPKTQPAAQVPPLPSFATLHDLTSLMGQQALARALADEADNLTADLTDLTAVLNERTLAILF